MFKESGQRPADTQEMGENSSPFRNGGRHGNHNHSQWVFFFFPKIPSLIFPGTTTVKTLFFFFLFFKKCSSSIVPPKEMTATELKRKKMTSEDLAERSTKSLCFRCNEKCGHRHVCKTLFMMRRRNGDRKIRRRSKRTISSSNFTPRMI